MFFDLRTTTLTACALTIGIALTGTMAAAKSSVVIGMQQEPTTLDPTADATASIDGIFTHNVFQSLTNVTETGEVLPDLATSWTISDDNLTYTFSLVQGAKYHDGSDFNADDVKFSFDRAMAEDSVNPSKGIFKSIASVRVVDPNTIEIVLSKPDAFFLFNMAKGDASIVAPETAEDNKTNPIGTGPFKFTSWTRGDRMILMVIFDERSSLGLVRLRVKKAGSELARIFEEVKKKRDRKSVV